MSWSRTMAASRCWTLDWQKIFVRPTSAEVSVASASQTQVGVVMGTPAYMLRNRHRAAPSTIAATFSRWAWCCTRWRRGDARPRPEALPAGDGADSGGQFRAQEASIGGFIGETSHSG